MRFFDDRSFFALLASWLLCSGRTTRSRKAAKAVYLFSDQLIVTVRPAIAEELPGVPHFSNHVEIQIGNHQRVLVARRLRDYLAAWIAEIALTVELADVPGLLVAHPVYRAHEVPVRHGVRGLFQLPEIFRETSDGRRWVEDDFGAAQSQGARAFREVAVIADVDADARIGSVECRVSEIARAKIEFLPKARIDVRDVVLSILAEIFSISIDDCGGVVVDTGDLF